MLTSLAATAAPLGRHGGEQRGRRRPAVGPRSSKEGKNGKSVRIVPSQASGRAPAPDRPRRCVADSTAAARPTPKADTAGGPSCGSGGRRPAARRTARQPRACRAGPPGRRSGPTTVSTMRQRHRAHRGQVVDVGQHRRDPGAVRVGRRKPAASPRRTRRPASPVARRAARAPSSPGPAYQSPAPSTSPTSLDLVLRPHARRRPRSSPHRASVELGHGDPPGCRALRRRRLSTIRERRAPAFLSLPERSAKPRRWASPTCSTRACRSARSISAARASAARTSTCGSSAGAPPTSTRACRPSSRC